MEPIQLTEVEFWKLKAVAEEAGRLKVEAAMTPQATAAVKATQRADEMMRELRAKYCFDATDEMMTLDEATLTLRAVTPSTPAGQAPPSD